MAKRPGSSLVLAQEPKKTKSDLVAYTNRDKALMEAVSNARSSGIKKINEIISPHLGCAKNLKSPGTHYAARRPSG